MAEETTNVVKTASDGTVKITVEKYHELVAKAAEKAPIIHNVTHKTKEVAAIDNKVWGAVFVGLGLSVAVIGGIVHMVGRAQLKELAE